MRYHSLEYKKQYKINFDLISMEDKKSEKEERIRAITKLYYSNPQVQQTLLKFAQNREVVPRYFEGFGKRPDMLQYQSDIMGLVNKGATSFHASEELWIDPLGINNEMGQHEFNNLRLGWDLLIDIDSPFLDFSKIAARLLIEELERFGIKNYGIKFSGSKGFHIIVSSKAFPKEFGGKKMNEAFPEYPRAICEYLMSIIKPRFAKETRNISNLEALQLKTNKKREELVEIVCPNCHKAVKQDKWITFLCEYCSNEMKQKKSIIAKKRKIRCVNCSSIMKEINSEDFFECSECKITNISKIDRNESENVKYTSDANNENISDMVEGLHEDQIGGFDLVLVASRHLFRMPYSLHEKTSLASIVLKKEEIEKFSPRDANPLTVKIREFLPENEEGEARSLLEEAINWKKKKEEMDEEANKKAFAGYKTSEIQNKEFAPIDTSKITDDMYPPAIKKLLKGLKDGKKRGLFILITFFRSLGYAPDIINEKIRNWNKLNEPPLKEGYLRGQIEWHLKQKKKILPPNYENPGFYKDLGLIDGKQKTKNPLVDVLFKLRNPDK